jgi:hypothetical protein
LLITLLGTGPVATAAEFYVSPTGSDTGLGTRQRPFATIGRARNALRELRARGGRPKPVTVFVRQGVYSLRQTLAFGPADSGTPEAPVIYRSYGRERAVITGGLPITGFVPYRDGVLKADLGGTPLAAVTFRVLVFAGERQELARYPNRDASDPNGGRWAFVDGGRLSMYADSPVPPGASPLGGQLDFWQRNRPELTRSLRLRPQDVRNWSRLEAAEVSIFPRFNWSHYMVPVESLDAERRTLRLGPGSFYEIRAGDRYFIRNLLEELDTPGEWYLDRGTATLYFWPPQPLGGRPAYAPVVGDVVELAGCESLTLRGFTIECGGGSGVVLRNCQRVTVAGNTIRNLGDTDGSGVVVEGGQGNAVVGNDIHDVGYCGIRLGGGDPFTLAPGRNRADNNYLHHVGLVGRGAPGIELTGARNLVSHNLIHDTPHSGITMWGSLHTLEYNRLRHTCLETEDSGAIGGGAIDWLSWQGAVIRYNWIQDTMGFGYDEAAGAWRSPYFTNALYPDWAASGVHIVGNVLVRAPLACLLIHSGRDNVIENNVLVDGGDAQVQWPGWTTNTGFWSSMVAGWIQNYEAARRSPDWLKVPTLKDPRTVPLPDGRVMHGNVFRRNIIAYRTPKASLLRWEDVPLERNQSDYNLVYHAGRPLRTGVLALAQVRGPNLLANPGLEEGPAGGFAAGWAWFSKATEDTTVAVADTQAHGGSRSLAVGPSAKGAVPPPGAVTMVAPGPALRYRPGQAYQFRAWLRTAGGTALVSLQAYSWKENTHTWTAARAVPVNDQWQEHELVFRLPAAGDSEYRATMDTFYVRLTFAPAPGTVWIDDVALREGTAADEWTAWRARGMDRHSVVADPRFVDPAHDDYRLRPGSPALKLGFRPIPFDRIGPYQSPLRATWPVVEAPGAREALARLAKGRSGSR